MLLKSSPVFIQIVHIVFKPFGGYSMKQKLIAFSFILILALIVYPLANGQGESTKARIIFIKGSVLLNGKKAKKGDELKLKDKLETKDKSLCIFKVGSKNIFKIKDNARLIYNITGEKGSHIKLEKGYMGGIVKYKKILAKDEFKINTPTLIAGVRGTSFAINVESDKQVYFCTCNGTVNFKDKNGKQEHSNTNARHGAERFILQDDGSVKIKKAGLEYHNDDDVEDLALEIDEEIDWSKPAK